MPHLIKWRQYNTNLRKSCFLMRRMRSILVNTCFFSLYFVPSGKRHQQQRRAPSTTVIAIKNNLLQGHHYLLECTISVFSHDQVFYICTKILRTDKLTLKHFTYQVAGIRIFMLNVYTQQGKYYIKLIGTPYKGINNIAIGKVHQKSQITIF